MAFLSKKLVLFHYILRQFGYEDFEDLRDDFNGLKEASLATGKSYFASVLTDRTEKLISNDTLLVYDEAILGYERKLRENRAEPFFSFKYYQWFALLFTEYFLDNIAHNIEVFVTSLNAYRQEISEFEDFEGYTPSDLKKLAFWMATGSGKTLILHCNYWQINKYLKDWENIILITPNEGLSRQHYDSFIQSGIPAKMYTGSEDSLQTVRNEVLILEITKLVKDKTGEGVSVDVDFFSESRNLVFIDEGHKGQKSEERKWKGLREHLTRGEGSFTFEYSATFGQIIGKNAKDLLEEYGKTIIFDYSYRHFYIDGYGKDFNVFNVDIADEYSQEQNELLLTASLLGFYEQLELFDKYREELRTYHIEKPLWVFVGSKVIGSGGSLTATDRQNVSDVSTIVKFFQRCLSNPSGLQARMKKILSGKSGLVDKDGEDVFRTRFEHLQLKPPSADIIIQRIFYGSGSIEAMQIKRTEGEIALKTKTGTQYFAIINIGDVPKYSKKLEEDTNRKLTVQDDHFTDSLFNSISDQSSSVNILIGSKKFIEGWNSWRVSSMGLMNMGKGEGPQIIQLFGRGVRLKGKKFSLKREESTAPYYVRALQTISIVGLNASYMNRFLEEIEKEVPEYTEYPIPIKFNDEEKWNGNILTFRTEGNRSFQQETLVLSYKSIIARRVKIDLRNKVSVASGFNVLVAETDENYHSNFILGHIEFIDLVGLRQGADNFRLLKGMTNLIIDLPVIDQILRGREYQILSYKGQYGIEEALNGRLQRVAEIVVKDYINKFYADCEKAFLAKYLTYKTLDKSVDRSMFPIDQKIIVKVPGSYKGIISELKDNIERLYEHDNTLLPTIHFSHHLYSPIVSWAKGEKFKEIKTVPARLNQGEKDFISHIRTYINSCADDFKDKEVFILRNLSLSGVGFFIESSSFYPDFIIWIVEKNQQTIYFLDPKGIRETKNFNNPKVIFCRDQIGDIEDKINKDLRKDQLSLHVSMQAYILSVTPFRDVCNEWAAGQGTTKEEFASNKILFIEDDLSYLKTLLGSQR